MPRKDPSSVPPLIIPQYYKRPKFLNTNSSNFIGP